MAAVRTRESIHHLLLDLHSQLSHMYHNNLAFLHDDIVFMLFHSFQEMNKLLQWRFDRVFASPAIQANTVGGSVYSSSASDVLYDTVVTVINTRLRNYACLQALVNVTGAC